MQQLVATLLSGLTLGAVYAAFALALCLIWRSTRVVNFAQAPMAMLTSYIALTLIDHGINWWVAFAGALVSGFVLGAVVERALIRRVEGKSELNAVILTLGLFIVLHAVAAIVFGSTYRAFPAVFGLSGVEAGGHSIPITGFGIFTLVAVMVLLTLLVLLFHQTDLGLKMRATAFSPETARLLGVRVGRMLTLGWALAAVAGALAGVLIAGRGPVSPGFMDSVMVYGFVAAVLGGLDSPLGSVVGGLVLGLALSFVSGYHWLGGAGLVPIASLVILIAVLLLRPGGLFSHVAARRV
ncbi:branched-chain amino acid ABC transporter permease [Cryptosporangium sp. NPDC051539]|uniref:branched-chain amino acid ABC transporter permease n=1 Tax=Cryptosporangium sp. NPDC051539 TaxID=3363962 RepID=UPI0037BDFA6C